LGNAWYTPNKNFSLWICFPPEKNFNTKVFLVYATNFRTGQIEKIKKRVEVIRPFPFFIPRGVKIPPRLASHERSSPIKKAVILKRELQHQYT